MCVCARARLRACVCVSVRLSLPFVASICILIIVCGFCLLPASFCDPVVNIRQFESPA